MKEHHFEKLLVWQRSCQLAQDTYRAFKGSRDFAYRDQMVRSSLSIPSNIAEGSERGSKKEFIRFLRFSLGSAAELRTQAYIAGELTIISVAQAQHLVHEAKEIGAMIQGLIRSLKQE